MPGRSSLREHLPSSLRGGHGRRMNSTTNCDVRSANLWLLVRRLFSSYGAVGDNPLGRLTLPAQPVDATPSNQLIRRYFPRRTDLSDCTRSKPSQGGVPADLT